MHGEENEQILRDICRESGMRMAGPNCLGLSSIALDLWACSLTNLPEQPVRAGNAALISQSGATGFGPLLNIALDRNVGLKYIVTTGNETDLSVCDFIEYMLEDDSIRSIGLLMEGNKEAKRFEELARRARKIGKPIIVLKIGESEVGARAAASHTASMTGDMAVFNAMCRQNGLIKAEDYDELLELMQFAQYEKKLKGRRVCTIAHSGGMAGFTGDLMGKYGFTVPIFCEETQKEIDVFLKGFGSPRNPLDLSTHMRAPYIYDIIHAVENHEQINAYVIASHGNPEGIGNIINAFKDVEKPMYFVWSGRLHDTTGGLDMLRENGIPISFSISRMCRGLSKLAEALEIPETGEASADTPKLTVEGSGFLNERAGKDLTASLGVRVPRSTIVTDWEAFTAQQPDFFDGSKYVMKVLSKYILHKSDIGGVALNVTDATDAKAHFLRMMDLGKITGHTPEGVMIEEMIPDGLDFVLGIRRDAQYGPVMVLGLGGIYTELFKLVSISIPPISKEQILVALKQIPGILKLLTGYRGQAKYDVDALVSAVKALSDYAYVNADHIKLLEINPLRVLPENGGVCALDCVIELD